MNLRFLQTALSDHKVGAVTESSSHAIRGILKALPARCEYVVEYGPGLGVVTRAVISHLVPSGRLVAIETNNHFVRELQKQADPRLVVLEDDVVARMEQWSNLGLPRIDAVISGIPFSFLAPRLRERLIKKTYEALAPGGVFVVYQYSPLVFPILKKYFDRVSVSFEPRNLPPYFIMKGVKL